MSFERTRNQQFHDLHRQQDDWDEVHQQLLAVQKKSMMVSDPGDADEKEADEVAHKVMKGESAEIHGAGSAVNRKNSDGDGAFETTPEFQTRLQNNKGGGQSLEDSTRNEMESKMGADLSGVKIHTGSEAHGMSESINAKAFTQGQDIFFRQGEFQPQSSQGKELLAHELTHTVQQGEGRVQPKVQRQKTGETIVDNGPSKAAGGVFDEGTGVYKVVGGDTDKETTDKIEAIAERFNTSSYAIEKINGLIHSYLKPGSSLTIPAPDYTQKVQEEAQVEKIAQKSILANINKINTASEEPNKGVWYEHIYRDRSKKYNEKDQNTWKAYGTYHANWVNYKNRGKQGYAPDTSWKQVGNLHWVIKPGVRPSVAIKEWLAGLTIAECYTVMVAIYLDAIRQAISDKQFDLVFSETGLMGPLYICQPPNAKDEPEEILKKNKLKNELTLPEEASGEAGKRYLKPGDWAYFKNNPLYLLRHPGGAWRGENAVYMGTGSKKEQMWSGFGASAMTEKAMMEEMKEAYNRKRDEDDYRRLFTDFIKPNLPDAEKSKKHQPGEYKSLYTKHIAFIPEKYRLPKPEENVPNPNPGLRPLKKEESVFDLPDEKKRTGFRPDFCRLNFELIALLKTYKPIEIPEEEH